MKLGGNYFELFGLPEQYHVDSRQLSEKFRELQSEVHPDRFAHASDRDKRLSVQYSTYINEAYQCLLVPLSRAIYLLERKGSPYDASNSTHQDMEFLMEQMELREALSELADQTDPEAVLDNLTDKVEARLEGLQNSFEKAISSSDLSLAADIIGKMQFVDKLHKECEAAEVDLLDY